MNFNKSSDQIRIVEVGPRDGLQNEKTVIKTEDKVDFIKDLINAGLKSLEVTSFVRSDKIPQMADAKDLYPKIENLSADLICLVPNLKGLEIAQSLNVKEIAVFTATSETFNKKNINASIQESLGRIDAVIKEAKKSNIKVRGYVSTAFGCPYEKETSIEKLIELTSHLIEKGAYEVSVGDTIGCATPKQVDQILKKLTKEVDTKHLALHMHDTRGMAIANILVGLEHGVRNFDSSAGGLGGCPYARGATGNVGTEDLVYLFDSLGLETGIDLEILSNSSLKILKALGRETSSKLLRSYENSNGNWVTPFI